ncbi:hypothetical protein ACQR3W_21715 [Rhodococcus ruber]|uniref:Uncharacterized protein n=1 Tax=Rhodococcus ruber TaxID=1830 RepID=A0A098BJV2_9NOCA|nr:hypothetical protein [Rhodococcus ruber]MCZ4533367.1 hypothetical protein [Rhodococcus ruber]MCZ4533382.1 hypothetical protein [Rhodococcus ruber]CDZ88973.1 hypothetical protein RHRU231_450140 [Rhodococcus ruber]
METRTEWWTVDTHGTRVADGATRQEALASHEVLRRQIALHLTEMRVYGITSGIQPIEKPAGVFCRTYTTTVVDSEIEEL